MCWEWTWGCTAPLASRVISRGEEWAGREGIRNSFSARFQLPFQHLFSHWEGSSVIVGLQSKGHPSYGNFKLDPLVRYHRKCISCTPEAPFHPRERASTPKPYRNDRNLEYAFKLAFLTPVFCEPLLRSVIREEPRSPLRPSFSSNLTSEGQTLVTSIIPPTIS